VRHARPAFPWFAALLAALASAVAVLPAAAVVAAPTPRAADRFQLQSRFWPSLHQTLMEAAQRDGVPNPGAGEAERATWDAAVARYRASVGDANPVRDEKLLALDEALSTLVDDAAPAALPYDVHEPLAAAAAVYRARLWPDHARGNELWIAVARALLEQVGDELLAAHERAYGQPYPQRFVVDVTPFGGRFGAYTNDLTFPHVTQGSRDPGSQGMAALESLFHEVSHTVVRPRGGAVGREIDAAERALGRRANGQLWHAIQFYTTGELTRRALATRGVPYTMMVEGRLWEGPFGGLEEAVETSWTPVLDGKATRDEAIRAIVERTAEPRTP
jgi:hypothetical protein